MFVRHDPFISTQATDAGLTFAKAGTPVAKIVPLNEEPEKFVFGTLKGLPSQQDEQALIDAIEAPLPDEIVAMFHVSPLEVPDK